MDIIVSFGRGQMPKGFPIPGTTRLPQRLAGDHQGGRGLQRARAASPPSSATSGPRTPAATTCTATSIFRGNGAQASLVEPFTTLTAAGQRQPGRPVEVDGRHRGEDRQRGARHRPQRQPEQRAHVPDGRGLRQEDRQRVRADARPLGAAVRDDPDQGHGRGASVPVAQRRVRRLRDLGQGQSRRQRGEDQGHARIRVRALRR